MTPVFWLLLATTCSIASAASDKSPVQTLIPWLLEADAELRGIPFGEVIFATTGKRLIPANEKDETDQRVLRQAGLALDETLKQLNDPSHPVQRVARINEVSSFFEESLRKLLDEAEGLACGFPVTNEDKVQRSGYPDLRLVDEKSGRVYYLDPKVYAAGSETSSFRTFYFQPRIASNKVREDAVHLLAGIEHDGAGGKGWRFTGWKLVDLSRFMVKLKAEFQGSNADLYRDENVVFRSER